MFFRAFFALYTVFIPTLIFIIFNTGGYHFLRVHHPHGFTPFAVDSPLLEFVPDGVHQPAGKQPHELEDANDLIADLKWALEEG